MFSLDGKVAFVTGGNGGIGLGIAKGFIEHGASVTLAARTESKLESAIAEIGEMDAADRVLAVKCDVTDRDSVQAALGATVEKFGGVDIVVNNAGTNRRADEPHLLSDEDWRLVIDTNLTSVYNFCQAAMKPMIAQKYGRIISMSSVAADFGSSGQVNYAASKGGIQGLTRCLAKEIARRNITVNTVAPGFCVTSMTEAVRNAAPTLAKSIPLKRFGQPQDVANAVLFLASDEASYITGHILTVDGGLTLGAM